MDTKLSLLDIAIMNGYSYFDVVKIFRLYHASYRHSVKKLIAIGYINNNKTITNKGKEALTQFEELYNEVKTVAN